MRVAFCLSGQLRTWRSCYESWQLLFDRFKEQLYIDDVLQHTAYADEPFEVDYFVHTWDFNTTPRHKWDVDFQAPETPEQIELLKPLEDSYIKVEKEEISEILNILKPKKSVVENWHISKTRTYLMDDMATAQTMTKTKTLAHLSWAGSQLYSIMKCAHLKRQYELENKFEYDLCIRSRFDLNFDENNRMIFVRDFEKPKPKTIYSVHNAIIDRTPFNVIGDIFYYADSQTFDLLATMYDTLPHVEQSAFSKHIKIEEVMSYITRMFLLNNKKLDFSPNVQRD